jgi:hypothetical protein
VIRWKLPDSARRAQANAFLDQFSNHFQKFGMHSHRAGAHQIHAVLARDVSRFGVQIVDHFHVIGNESDGHNHHVGAAIHFAKHLADIWL